MATPTAITLNHAKRFDDLIFRRIICLPPNWLLFLDEKCRAAATKADQQQKLHCLARKSEPENRLTATGPF
jgi:hypothetical protein